MTLTAADLLAIVGAIFGTLLIVGGGALAWLRADIARLDLRQRADTASLRAALAKLDERQRSDVTRLDERQRADTASLRAALAKLDERQRADTAAINMRLDTLTQTIITSALARGPQADVPAERAGKAARAQTAPQA